MIDIHCHILPGIDDGPQTLGQAVEMARIAWADGITDIIATPHTHDDFYVQEAERVLEAVESFQTILELEGIPLRIHPGMEVHIHWELIDHLRDAHLLSLGNHMKHVLLELPSLHLPLFTEEVVQQLLLQGITPVIAHPERNAVLMNHTGMLAQWIEWGVVCQITAGSLLGWLGNTAQKNARALVGQRLVHLLASDGHNCNTRKIELSQAYEELGKLMLASEVDVYRANAQAILEGQACDTRKFSFF
ncbi:tyrosine-protein phosphatase [Brevibacillus sp. 179-C9.3 HS]|uniref:tyrosine-protein phosphatase n=1 Tax=unclassified Brevibacillus TaxID=2684853 RepID=UPI0039A02D87